MYIASFTYTLYCIASVPFIKLLRFVVKLIEYTIFARVFKDKHLLLFKIGCLGSSTDRIEVS